MPNDDLREPQIADARKSNSCSGFSDFEFQELKSIAETYIAASGLLMTLVELAGRVPQSAINQLPEDWSLKLNQLGEQALTAAYDVAVWSSWPAPGLDDTQLGESAFRSNSIGLRYPIVECLRFEL